MPQDLSQFMTGQPQEVGATPAPTDLSRFMVKKAPAKSNKKLFGNFIDAMYGGFEHMSKDPVVQAVAKPIGVTTGLISAGTGALVGGASKMASNLYHRKKVMDGVREQAIASAKDNYDLGKTVGTVGATGAPLYLPAIAAASTGGALGLAAEGVALGSNLAGFGLSGAAIANGPQQVYAGVKDHDLTKAVMGALETGGGLLGAYSSGKALGDQAVRGYSALSDAVGKVTDPAVVSVRDKGLAAAKTVSEKLAAGEAVGDDGLPKGRIERVIQNTKNALDERRAMAVESPEHRLLLDRGWQKKDVDFIESLTPDEAAKAETMIKNEVTNSGKRIPGARAVDTAGEVVADNVDYLHKVRGTAGQQIDDAIQALPDEPMDLSAVSNEMDDVLAKLNVHSSIDDANKLDFSDSFLAEDPSAAKQVQKLYLKLQPDANGEIAMTPSQIRTTRQQMFKALDLAKKPNGPGAMSGEGETVLSGLRDSLDEPLKAASKEYAEAAKVYARTSEQLRDFYTSIGRKWTGNETFFDRKIGEWAQQTLGNAGADKMEVINGIESLARELGYKGTVSAGNMNELVLFLKELLGTTQENSLQGNIERAGANVLSKGVQQGGIPILSEAVGVVKEGALKALEVTTKERVTALLKFLEYVKNKPSAANSTGAAAAPVAAEELAMPQMLSQEATMAQLAASKGVQPGMIITDFPFDGVTMPAQVVSVAGELKVVPKSVVTEAIREASQNSASGTATMADAVQKASVLINSSARPLPKSLLP